MGRQKWLRMMLLQLTQALSGKKLAQLIHSVGISTLQSELRHSPTRQATSFLMISSLAKLKAFLTKVSQSKFKTAMTQLK